MFRYGVHMNRLNEESFKHHMYNWQYWDKRNRLCHNMIMEHFEVHKEQLEDLIVDMQKNGPKVLMDLPPKEVDRTMNLNQFAIIDEICGLNNFLEGFLAMNDVPETVKARIRARMFTYDSDVPKEIALNEMRETLFGTGR